MSASSGSLVFYFAEIAGVRAAVDPDDEVEIGIVLVSQKTVWAHCTWRELAAELREHPLRRAVIRSSGAIVAVHCSVDDSLARAAADTGEELPLSSDEAALILETLRENGRPDLAEICEPILERCTRTDPPPPEPPVKR